MSANAILVDARNFEIIAPRIITEVAGASLIGFDIETEDSDRHDGLNQFMKVDEDGFKSAGKKLVFDTRRTTVCGFSLYPDGGENAYYVNLAHADVENRVPWHLAKTLLDARGPEANWIIHNAPFEMVMMKGALDFDVERFICTLQMAVSAYGPDEYDRGELRRTGLGAIKRLIPEISRAFRNYERHDLTPEQGEVLAKVIAKESDSAHSWNGVVDEIAYHYDLKRAVKSWFAVQMRTFEETLRGKAHMGQLTGEEVVEYGADDAFWAVALYHVLLDYMLKTNPAVVETYFNQELPMVEVYADVWRSGMKVNREAIERRRATERENCAAVLRKIKAAVNECLPFPEDPCLGLLDEKWYAKNGPSYRQRIIDWASLPDSEDAFTQVTQVSGAVANAWRMDGGKADLNLTHYMPMRTLMYDLLGEKVIKEKGKVQSDGDTRGKLLERMAGKQRELQETVTQLACDPTPPEDPAPYQQAVDFYDNSIKIVKGLSELASIEQRMKLYLTPYTFLTDPETNRMYPVLSSKLATRRMATAFPNPMQLAKRGESTYVRGFFEPD